MVNKYRINDWKPNGPLTMHEVIVKLIDELRESLETPIMEKSKSDEEVRKILKNPEGIRIEELQTIDVWNIGRGLRRELRVELDEAYSFLSTRAAQIIVDRNEIVKRDRDGDININEANRKLKNTIVNQYEAIEKKVEYYEKKYEKEGELSEKERKLLVYIRKVYSSALREAIKKLFSTAASSTERVKIFPREEQDIITNKINSLKNRISSLTWEDKQKKKEQQREDNKNLELEKKELEKGSATLKQLKDALNSSFPNLIDSENKVNEEIQKSMVENLTELREIQKQAGKENEVIKKAIKDLKDLIKNEVDDKTSQKGLDHAETRICLNKVVDGIEKGIVVELEKEIIKYQNQQIQLPKK